jgi:hypothetical protein
LLDADADRADLELRLIGPSPARRMAGAKRKRIVGDVQKPEKTRRFPSNRPPPLALVPDRSHAMQEDRSSQGIVLDEKSQEQPKDKERAQTAHQSGSGHRPQQPAKGKADKSNGVRK